MKLKNKVAIVTGSSRGIGKAAVLFFAKEGAKVVVNYSKSKEEAEKVVEEIKKLGSEAIAVACDVSDEAQVKKMIEETVEKFGRIDILVNNAGVVFDAPFEERTVEQFRRTLEVNLIGAFLCAKYASLQMKREGGAIVNVASNSGVESFNPDSIDYDASKAGVVSLTKDLAGALAPKIRVNCVAPGWVETEMNKDLPPDYAASEEAKTPLGRFAKPGEIAKAILFFSSDDSSFATGSVLIVDGGYGSAK